MANSLRIMITGGLGNQLFCLFYLLRILYSKSPESLRSWHSVAKSISAHNIKLLVIPPAFCKRSNVLNSVLATRCPVALEYNRFSSLLYLLCLKIDSLLKHYSSLQYRYLSYSQSPLYQASFLGKNLQFGYFNSLPCQPATDQAIQLISNLFGFSSSSTPQIAVHIRRGDYVSSGMTLTPVSHYISSIEYFERHYPSAKKLPIVIYTDSPDDSSVACMFSHFGDRLSISSTVEPLEILRELACSQFLAASNSSLSLWAALLSENQYSTFPSLWLDSPYLETQSLFGQYCDVI